MNMSSSGRREYMPKCGGGMGGVGKGLDVLGEGAE